MISARARVAAIGATAALGAALVAPIAQAAERRSGPTNAPVAVATPVVAALPNAAADSDRVASLSIPELRRPIPLAPLQLAPPAESARPSGGDAPAGAAEKGKPRVLYLTIDDGPDPTFTPQILKVLADNDAKATFFILGRNAVDNRDLVADVVAQGHAIGNHTWNHPFLPNLSDGAIRSEFTRTAGVIGKTSCMRAPYGASNARVNAVAKNLGMRRVGWGVDTRDWKRPGSKLIAQRIGWSKPGSTILMHDGGGDRAQTVAALKRELPILRAKGYTFETYPACR